MRLDEKYPDADIILRTNRGGVRANSGRKPKPYSTDTISFRVRVEHIEQIKRLVKDAAKILDEAADNNLPAPEIGLCSNL